MNDLILLIWLADISSNVSSAAVTLCFVAGAAAFCCYGASIDSQDKKIVKLGHKCAVSAVTLGLACALIPSRDAIYAMAAVYGVNQVAETQIGSKALKLLEQKIDKALAEGEQK
jgi:hypothetical protein